MSVTGDKNRSGQRATITTVAETAGVSIATVSRVLNRQRSRISEATRQKVFEAAEAVAYQPDPRFRLIGRYRTQGHPDTGQLGFLICASAGRAPKLSLFSNPYATLFFAMAQESRRHKRHLTFDMVGEDDYLPRFIKDRQVDGAIVSGDVQARVVERVAQVTPVVMVNKMLDQLPGISSIMPDNTSTIQQAMDHLRELGHRRIFYFDIDDAYPPNIHHRLRSQAFVQLTRGNDEASSIILTHRDKSLRDIAREHLLRWREARRMPTALLCATDHYAIAFLEAAEDLNLAVPERLSVIGIDDVEWCEHTRPTLTSMRRPLEAMGRAAVRTLLERLELGEDAGPATMQLFPVELILRQSTGPAPDEA